MHIPNENYHVYNRGAHKAPIFLDGNDYWRFLRLLYIANSTEPVKFYRLKLDKIFSSERKDTLVEIIAYCLMPNHFHLVLKGKTENNVPRFLHKLCTSYSMYYNKKYDHSGTIFQGPYKEKYVDNDDYFRYLIQYVHLNPFGIIEPDLNKHAKSNYIEEALEYSKSYEYSSLKDYLGENRPQKSILTSSEARPRYCCDLGEASPRYTTPQSP